MTVGHFWTLGLLDSHYYNALVKLVCDHYRLMEIQQISHTLKFL